MLTVFIPWEWYLTVFCSGCKQRIPVFRDMIEDKSQLVRGYNLVCPFAKAFYKREKPIR